MRLVAPVIAAFAMLLAPACTPGTAPPASNSSQPADIVTIVDDSEAFQIIVTRRLIDAELAYQAAAQLALQGISAGIIKGDTARAVRNINRDALATLAAAKAGKTVADRALEVGRLEGLIASLQLVASSGAVE